MSPALAYAATTGSTRGGSGGGGGEGELFSRDKRGWRVEAVDDSLLNVVRRRQGVADRRERGRGLTEGRVRMEITRAGRSLLVGA